MTSGNKFYLKCPGAQLTIKEREYIKSAAEQLNEKFPCPTFVNLGVMWGASMHCLRAGSEDAFLVGIDIDFDTHQLQKPDILGLIHESIEPTAGKMHMLKGMSAIYGDTWNGDIHILFVDADHSYEAVKADIKAWSPHVVRGGLMIFHDYAPTEHNLNLFPEIAGVRKAVDEWYGVEGVRENNWVDRRLLYNPPDSLFAVRKL